jgi:phage terminase small subunit
MIQPGAFLFRGQCRHAGTAGKPLPGTSSPEGAMSLTDRQSRFVDEYLVDLNGTQAAIRAGYAPKRADQQASRLLARKDIADEVALRQAARAERTQIDADWVLTRLSKEATADLADLYDADGSLKPVHDWPLIWRQGLVAGIEVDEIRAGDVVVGQVRKVKLSDRIKRIELIGKHVNVQAFRDQVEQTGVIHFTVSKEDAEL